MSGKLNGKVTVITGAAQGIGWTYAETMAKEGAKVVVNDILDCDEPSRRLCDSGAEAIGVKADVTDLSAMEAVVEQAVDAFGRVDILVNNAAIYAGIRYGSFFDISMEEWERVIKVNITGTFVPTRAITPLMKEQRSGKIVNISSAAVYTGIPDFVHYTAAKAAVIGMTRAIARELGPYGITVNAVAPGYIMAPSNEAQPKLIDELNVNQRCIQRSAYPKDVVGTVLFLASSDSDFVTGQTIIVDGGIAFD